MFIIEELSRTQAISEVSVWPDRTADCSAEFFVSMWFTDIRGM